MNTVTANVTAFSGLVPVELGFTVNPGTGYRLELATGSASLYYNTNGAVYPYTTVGCPVTIAGAVNPALNTGGQYLYFYNWEVRQGCSSNRIPVTAVVLSTPAIPTVVVEWKSINIFCCYQQPMVSEWHINSGSNRTGLCYYTARQLYCSSN